MPVALKIHCSAEALSLQAATATSELLPSLVTLAVVFKYIWRRRQP